jgi:hypothetical protein
MSQKHWFFFSAMHKEWMKKVLESHEREFHVTLCKLDDGRVVEYTAATDVGKPYDNFRFSDYTFLGEGVFHQ